MEKEAIECSPVGEYLQMGLNPLSCVLSLDQGTGGSP